MSELEIAEQIEIKRVELNDLLQKGANLDMRFDCHIGTSGSLGDNKIRKKLTIESCCKVLPRV